MMPAGIAADERDPSRRWLIAAGLVAFTVVRRWPLIVQPRPIDDEVNYAVVARELLHGSQLYVGAIERRPPLTMWLYAWVLRLFGEDNWKALHATELVWVLLTMAALYVLAGRLFGRRAGMLAALLYSAFQPWWTFGDLAFNGEVLMNLPIAAAYAIVLASGGGGGRATARCAAAGAMIAIAALLKQPAAIAIAPLLMWTVVSRRAAASVALCVGFAAPIVLVGVWLARQHVLAQAIYWSVLDHDVPHIFWADGASRTADFALACGPLIAGAIWTLRQRALWRGRLDARGALAALAVASAIGAAASGRFFPHYYIALLPPMVVLAAPAVDAIGRELYHERPRARAAAFAALAWLAAACTVAGVRQWQRSAGEAQSTEAGRYLHDHAPASARVFVWGRMPRIYLESDRRPASRYIDSFALTGRIFGPDLPHVDTTSRIVPGAWAQLADDFEHHAPDFIVDTEAHPGAEYPVARFGWFDQLLQREYVLVAQTAEGRIYERRLALSAGTHRDTRGGRDRPDR